MAKVIIFGQRDYAQQAQYYLTHDSPHEVVAFCVTADQRQSDTVFGLPLVVLEEVVEKYPPGEYQFFAPMSGRSMNKLREQFYLRIKALGYSFVSYISSRASICHNEIGENCLILEHTTIQPFVRIGNNVMIWCNVHVGHHSVIEDHVTVISGAVICGRCHIGAWSYLAANCVINDTIKVAEGTLAGISSLIKTGTEPWGIYTGIPAKHRKTRSDAFEFL